jgi:hypothetical protein
MQKQCLFKAILSLSDAFQGDLFTFTSPFNRGFTGRFTAGTRTCPAWKKIRKQMPTSLFYRDYEQPA